MFDAPGPRVFATPPGADFAAELVAGLRTRMAGAPPEAMARVTLWLNSQRMARRVTQAFAEAGPGLLPRLRLVTDLAQDEALPGLPQPVPPLRRRLHLARAVEALLDREPGLAPRTAIWDLADSLAALMDEMQGEDVPPNRIAALDVSEHSAHWQRMQRFMGILAPYFGDRSDPDVQTRQRLAMDRIETAWQAAPPPGPVIVAGSTGSRGTTARLMRAVAGLPQGALVLPGFDFDLPDGVWDGLADAMTAEDHPQFRFDRLLRALDLAPRAVARWTDRPPPDPTRNALVSLAMRPAPVTDQWLTDGASLRDLPATTEALTLIEAPDPRGEALAIALVLREAAEAGTRAALVSPDRTLTRRVTAALDRWGIRPDDSAGRPLGLSAPGRFLRHVAGLFGERLTSTMLLTLLKHPLTASGGSRGPHLLFTRELELSIRRTGPVFPVAADLRDWATRQNTPAGTWADWLATAMEGLDAVGRRPLADHVRDHRALAERLAAGPDAERPSGALWDAAAGEAARGEMDALEWEAGEGGVLGPADYRALVAGILAAKDVREAVQTHPDIAILGPREVREHDCALLILGGLNDGSWPQSPPPDPWMNRQMRLGAGLLLPERRIGLAAHDFQQAVGAPRVVLTRALRGAEAETVPSRWLNRLTNLLGGLPDGDGQGALAAMRARGARWTALAARADTPRSVVPPAHRPAPRPPVEARPKTLAVTGIRTLVRDPYAIYARHILRLYPLGPLNAEPDARLRGSILHRILERFAVDRPEGDARARLLEIAADVLAQEVPWPAARLLWQARLARATDHLLSVDADLGGVPVVIEEKGTARLPAQDFTLTARPDRIDLLADGRVHIFDYKTGAPPTEKQQASFDKQLLLEAAMAVRGAFGALGGPRDVAGITYIGLGSGLQRQTSTPEASALDAVWSELETLIASFMAHAKGYTARRAMHGERFPGDYDHLARFGEWEMTDSPRPEDVG